MAQQPEATAEQRQDEEPGPVLLRSKVAIPVLPPEHLSRPRLLAALEAARSRRLTLVAAPAGSGKTRLLVEWCRRLSPARPAAWLSLDDYDNDPVTFWTYIHYAVREPYPDHFNRSLTVLSHPGVSLTRAMLPLLLNELWEADQETVIILDDFH